MEKVINEMVELISGKYYYCKLCNCHICFNDQTGCGCYDADKSLWEVFDNHYGEVRRKRVRLIGFGLLKTWYRMRNEIIYKLCGDWDDAECYKFYCDGFSNGYVKDFKNMK